MATTAAEEAESQTSDSNRRKLHATKEGFKTRKQPVHDATVKTIPSCGWNEMKNTGMRHCCRH
jgi:hypothetical protein